MIPLPELGPTRPLVLPTTVERVLVNGLTVIAVQRSSVPIMEMRLRIPFAHAHLARSAVLTQTLFSGTSEWSTVRLAAEIQKIGGELSAGADPDRLIVSGCSLSDNLDRLLEILAMVLTDAAYPSSEVVTERTRLADRIRIARSQPAHIARMALLRRIYPGHSYAVQTPTPEQVLAVGHDEVAAMHAERVHPIGATLVLVGDLDPEKAIDAAERALTAWDGTYAQTDLPAIPPLTPGPLSLVDRPGSFQSSLRLALPAVGRRDPDHPALQLANLVFGGYFSSRWVENIREDKGYTYGPHSSVEHNIAGSSLIISTDVSTEVTAPALLETLYELGKLATLAPSEEELNQARQYALGTFQLGMSTQAGIAGLVSAYAGYGLRLDYLRDYTAKLATVTCEDVAQAAARYLAPSQAVTVVLGDAEKIEAPLSTLMPLVRVEGAETSE